MPVNTKRVQKFYMQFRTNKKYHEISLDHDNLQAASNEIVKLLKEEGIASKLKLVAKDE